MSRQFSEKDAAAILKRAAELQEKASAGGSPEGVSLSDLKRIAEESGIDPSYVEQALIQQAAAPVKGGGGKVLELSVPGELAPDRLDVVSDILSTHRGFKPLTQVGRTVQGFVQGSWGPMELQASSRNGKTKVTVRPMLGQTFMMTGYTPALLAVLACILGLALKAPLIGLGIAAVMGVISWQLTAFGFKKAEESAGDVMRKLVEGIHEEIQKQEPASQERVEDDEPDRLRQTLA